MKFRSGPSSYTPNPDRFVDPQLKTVHLTDPQCDDTVVHLGDLECITVEQETEFGDEMTVVLSREMLHKLWPHVTLWLKL